MGIMGLEELRDQENGATVAEVMGTGEELQSPETAAHGRQKREDEGAGTGLGWNKEGRKDMEGTQRYLWERGKPREGLRREVDAQNRTRGGGRCPRAWIHVGRGQEERALQGRGIRKGVRDPKGVMEACKVGGIKLLEASWTGVGRNSSGRPRFLGEGLGEEALQASVLGVGRAPGRRGSRESPQCLIPGGRRG